MKQYMVTNSERSSMACAQLWFYKYGLGLTREASAWPLTLGSLWHEMMESYRILGSSLTCSRLEEMEEQARLLEEDLDPLESPDDSADLSQIRLVRRMLQGYIKRYWSSEGRGFAWSDGTVHTLHGVEDVLDEAVVTPSGRLSPWSRYGGKADGWFVDDDDQCWLVEYKSTSRELSRWLDTNGYNPQVSTYSVLLRQRGLNPVGVIYDLVRTAAEPTVEEYRVNKDGRLSKVLPKFATIEGLASAIAASWGFGEMAISYGPERVADEVRERQKQTTDREGLVQPWYIEYLDQDENTWSNLPSREHLQAEVLFRRERLRFGEGELDRQQREMYGVATQARRWHERVGHWYETIRQGDWRSDASEAVRDVGHFFPRASAHCMRWGRPCAYTEFCQHPCADALQEFRLKDQKHEELP